MGKATNKQNVPWYSEGLRFECTQCGDCCTGAPGYVWVNAAEVEALAAATAMTVADFEKQHVRRVGVRRSLKEYANGDCVLFDAEKRCCTVYDARPRQCKTWPFWRSNLKNEAAWRETCEACPGSGRGKLYQLTDIEEQANVLRL